MRYITFLFLLLSPLFSITLHDYVDQVLRDSDKAKNIAEQATLSKYDIELAENRFTFKFSPLSSAGIAEDSKTMSLGVKASKETTYGGQFYNTVQVDKNIYTNSDDTYGSQITLGYTQSLFKEFGERYNTYALLSAKKQDEIQEYENRILYMDLMIEAVRVYYNVQLQKMKVGILDDTLERQQINYDAARSKQKVGIVSKVDVHRARLAYLNAQKSHEENRRAYKDAKENAFILLSRNFNEQEIFSTPITKITSTMGSIRAEDFVESSFDWKVAMIEKELLDQEILNSKESFLPDLKLDFSYTFNNEDTEFGEAWSYQDDKDQTWKITASSDYSFDLTDERVAYNKILIRKKAFDRDIKTLNRTISKNIRELMREIRQKEQSLEIEALKKEEARESLNVAKLRYERGLSTNSDVLDAEAAYEESQIAYITEMVNYNLSYLNLQKTLDRLDYEMIKKVIPN